MSEEAEPDAEKAETEKIQETKPEEKPELAAAPVVAPAVVTADPAKLSIFDLAAGVLLLAFVSLFAVNIFIANLAYDYNERMCHIAIALAGKAASDGKDSVMVRQAANGFMDKCGPGGFFVERPELITFYDEITAEKRQVSVATSTRVLIPAPFIVADKTRFDRDGMHMTFKSVCQFQLKNPKNCDPGKVKINPTEQRFEIKMSAPAVVPEPKKEEGKTPPSPDSKPEADKKKGPKPVANPGSAG